MAWGRKKQDPGIERQELWCHECDKHVQFDLDLSLNGNHVLECPNCGHEHCRVVKDGVITSERWAQRNGPTIHMSQSTANITYSTTSVTVTIYANSASTFTAQSWFTYTSGTT